MARSREEVRQCVVHAICRLVDISQQPTLSDATDPLRSLGLESDDGLDFACDISEQLGFHFPNDKNPFIDDSGRRGRLLGEIVDMIIPMLPD